MNCRQCGVPLNEVPAGHEHNCTVPTRRRPDRGRPSPGFAHLGVWLLSLGPDSPLPGRRLEIAILDAEGQIIRRFEQIRGECTDPGYVDFFLGANCRPAQHHYPVVDIDEHGKVASIIFHHYEAGMGMKPYVSALKNWAETHGRPEYAL